ncbi:protocadherin alpha-3-like isoform X3 [Clarias gariepinus]|uniref:protocadherin alpha-3-like isoform X3 n=1 Tax=Clarias gariepinus TaxID=13013 RepID=UPI00234D8421|nr:protocadherin alpha-3-like isoform X3 [Clarias gariepinus]
MGIRAHKETMRIWFIALLCLSGFCTGQIIYSLSEEAEKGTFVGNIVKDLNVNMLELDSRELRVVSTHNKRYFDINLKTGVLYVNERIDRDELCSNAPKCLVRMEAILNNPLHLHRIEVIILDINDNAPFFYKTSFDINITESAHIGEKLLLPEAKDADIGTNSVKSYRLSQNEHFSLDIQSGEQTLSAELVLQKALDREKQPVIQLTLTAIDGGKPPRTGSAIVVINVVDVNDNTPIFSKQLYKVRVSENTPAGTTLIKLEATDLDEGVNGDIVYSLTERDSSTLSGLFTINEDSGEIIVQGRLDYEENPAFEIRAQASDRGHSPRSAHCKVLVEVADVNDNAPEITLTSLTNTVREDSALGSVIALMTVTDLDNGKNGDAKIHISDSKQFKMKSSYKNYYSLVVDGALDRENVSQYNITVTATDEGNPPLSSTAIITVHVSDVNDNAPRFPESVINVYVKENSQVGAVFYRVSAFDPDVGDNSRLSYSLLESSKTRAPISSMISINSDSGDIYSLQSFNYEELKMFQFTVQAIDSGSPPLSSNVTVNVFILDENDNSPRILTPYSDHGSFHTENIPHSAEASYFVTKIRAVDPDSGYNALLSYHISEPQGNNLFQIGTSSGEIRTKRRMSDNDLKTHHLVILVSDNGEPSLSSTVSLDVVVVKSTSDIKTELKHSPIKEDSFSDLNIYLLISTVSVSGIFVLSLFTLIVAKCRRNGNFSRYSTPVITTHPDGSWSYSKSTQQYDVCFSSDTLKSDVVVFPAPFLPADAELISINQGEILNRTQTLPNTDKPKPPGADWRYSASLRAGMQSSVHMEESSVMQGAQGVLVQNWPTVSSAPDNEGGEVSPPVGAGVDSNSWHFRYGPGPGMPPQHLKPGEVPPEAFIIPGSPAIISIRQGQDGDDKGDFITFGKKEEAKKKKKKKKEKEKKDKKEKGKDDDD